MKTKNIIVALTAFLVSGCTQLGVGIVNLPSKFSGVEIHKDIAYGDEPWQKMDIYVPSVAKEKKLPVIVFFYGGRWTEGNKEMYAFVGDVYAKNNFIVVIADYRKYPQVKFPSFINDGAKTVAWTHKNIEKYGGDINNLFLSGHSAGAHTGAMLAADESYLAKYDLSNNIIKGFAGLAGPYDFIPDAEDLKDIFGPPEKYPNMRVTTFIEGDEPPMLLLWGAKDEAVYERNIALLEKKIKEKNGCVTAKIYPDIDHVEIISSLTWLFRSQAPVLEDTLNFYKTQMEKDRK